jgi:glutamine amidotransferase
MCELFAMSSSQPTAVNYSMHELARHGGLTADNADGWGLAYMEQGDARVFRDIDAAAESPYLRFVAAREFHSEIVISHIRRATQGAVALRNTQPFARELGGRIHLFAHNGDLHGLDGQPGLQLARYLPIGETDSERAFCVLLGRLSKLWSRPGTVPDLDERTRVVSELAREIRSLGPANFAYTDGDAVFLHGHRRRHPTDGAVRPQGLHLLCRSCQTRGSGARPAAGQTASLPGMTVATTQHVVLAASVPLTDEAWMPLDEGEVVVLRRGLHVETL